MGQIEGFILTGGASSRIGQDKALLRLGGKTLLTRAAEALSAVSQNVCIVGESFEHDFGLPVLPDVYNSGEPKRRAAIIGLHAALAHSKMTWAAVLACDLPFVTQELFARLVSIGEISKDDFDAVVPVQPDGRLQPLCALYRPGTCLPEIERKLAVDDWGLQKLSGEIKVRRIEFSELRDLPNSENIFFNVNTTDDLNAAIQIEHKLSNGSF